MNRKKGKAVRLNPQKTAIKSKEAVPKTEVLEQPHYCTSFTAPKASICKKSAMTAVECT
jgi:hypothetical protein